MCAALTKAIIRRSGRFAAHSQVSRIPDRPVKHSNAP
jgi:hypothetical protein